MKNLLVILLICCVTSSAFGQGNNKIKSIALHVEELIQNKTSFKKYDFFMLDRKAKVSDSIPDASVLDINLKYIEEIELNQPEFLEINIPTLSGNIKLELYRVNIFTEDFNVLSSMNNEALSYSDGVHYRGIIKDNYNSLVSISITEKEVMGFLSDGVANFVLGKLKNDKDYKHVIYDDQKLKIKPNWECNLKDDINGVGTLKSLNNSNSITSSKCIRIYWEIDNSMVSAFGGSVQFTLNFITGLFNQSATIFANDNISVKLSSVFVWVDPQYYGNTSAAYLAQFQNYRVAFNGDLGHLLTLRNLYAGTAAGFAGLCNINRAQSLCHSDVSGIYATFPTFSWDVLIVTHEQGHLLGSRHTHACVWNGNNTAIDNCAAPEGTCTGAPAPVNGGTIMSYCSQTSYGTNFQNGFGSQPATLIQNNVTNAICLNVCPIFDSICNTDLSAEKAVVMLPQFEQVEDYLIKHKFTLKADTIDTDTLIVKAYSFNHAWVQESGHTCIEVSVNPSLQPSTFAYLGTNSLVNGEVINNNSNANTNVYLINQTGTQGSIYDNAKSMNCISRSNANTCIVYFNSFY